MVEISAGPSRPSSGDALSADRFGRAAGSAFAGAGSRARWLLALVLLLGVTAAVYAPIRGHAFINFDDNVYVTENAAVRDGLTAHGLAWAFGEVHAGHWHPLTWVSHMLDCELWGLDAGAHLMVNLGLHLANVLLVGILLVALTGQRWRSLFVAALFALHPLGVETVAWVTSRKGLLSTFFLLLCLLAYRAYTRRPSLLRYLPVALAFALALAAKPTVMALPVLLLLLDYWPLRRWGAGQLRARLLEKLPLLLLAAADAAVTLMAQDAAGALVEAGRVPLDARLATAVAGWLGYIGHVLWPADLAIFYPLRPPLPGLLAVGVAVLVAITAFSLARARSHPWLPVGWLWYVVAIAPVIGLVQAGGQAMADRYTYVPALGLFVAAVWSVAHAWEGRQWPRRLGWALAVIPLAAGAWATAAQVTTWRDSVSVFTQALAATHDNFMAHTNLGAALEDLGRTEDADRHYREAVRLNPTYPEAQNNMGYVEARAGRYEAARGHFEEAVRLRPGFAKAWHNLGTARARQEDYGGAVEAYRRALSLAPDDASTHLSLGEVLELQGLTAEALPYFEEAVERAPDWVRARVRLGRGLTCAQRWREAEVQWARAETLEVGAAERWRRMPCP